MKKMLATVLVTTMALIILAGCSSPKGGSGAASGESQNSITTENTSQAQNQSEDTGRRTKVIVGISGDVATLAPFYTYNPYRGAILSTIYMNLGSFNEKGELEGALMKEWTQDDEYTYTIKIYDYIQDTAGNPLTASDVAFSFREAKAAGLPTEVNYIESVEVVDDYVVKLKFNSPAPGVFETVLGRVYIVTQKAYEASPDKMATQPVGTTQYQVTSFNSGSSIVCEKIDDFWQKDGNLLPTTYDANVDVIEYNIITESTQMEVALQTNAIQLTWTAAANIVDDYADADKFNVFETSSGMARYIAYNCVEGSIMDNQTLRQAFSYAIDQHQIAAAVTTNLGRASKGIGTTYELYWNKEWENEEYYDYDVNKAKELLAQAGYSEDELTIRILVNNTAANKTIAEIIQGNLKAIGVNAKLEVYDSATYTVYKDATAGEYEILIAATDQRNNIIMTWNAILNSKLFASGLTQNGVNDKELQDLIEYAQTANGFSQETANQIHELVKEKAYMYGTYVDYKYVICPKSITDVWIDTNLIVGACTYGPDYDVYAD